jgi:hypothetical protein
MSRATRALLVIAILSLAVTRGRGHGGTPVSTGVFFESDRLIVPARYWGLFVGPESGPWRWICDEAISADQTPNPTRSWARAGSGVLHASDFRGVLSSRDGGCTWVPAVGEIAVRPSAQVVADPVSATTAWAVTYDSQSAYNALYRTDDDGKTWVPTLQEDAYLNSVAISADGQTIYVGGVERQGGAPVLYLSRSRGQTFSSITPNYLLDGAVPTTLRVLAVDPSNDSIVWLAASKEPKRALVKASGDGAVYEEQFQLPVDVYQVAFDGTTVWAATQAGLRKSVAGGAFAAAGDLSQTQCVIVKGATIYACSTNYQPDLKVLARSDDGGNHFVKVFQFSETAGPLETCPAGTPVATLCPPLWDLYAERLGVPVDRPDMGSDGGGFPPPPPSGCSLTGF